MNTITICENTYIQIESADLLTANAPFYHADRIAPFHVLIYCIDGCINVAEDDTEYSIKAGECLIMKSGHHQKPTTVIKEGTSWIYVHFFTQNVPTYIDKNDTHPEITIPQYEHDLKNSPIEKLLYQFIEIVRSNNNLDRLKRASFFKNILISLYENSISEYSPKLYEELQKYMDNSLHTHITTRELEEHFHLSYKYMEHIFKKNIGLPIMQYHTSIRILESAKALRSTTKTILEISKSYGFEDQLYFSRCFKKHMGVSPKKYRLKQMIL